MKVVTIVGARPQFIKAAPVSSALRKHNNEVLVHTGQHYDSNMSDIFFSQLKIPKPDYNLGVGSGTHGIQTGKMLEAIEQVLLKERPDWVLVYGDTNSTLAGALAAAKLHIPVAHVEAGLRSYNLKMPEEINRKLTDHLSSLLLCPTKIAVSNLQKEGLTNILNDGNLIDLNTINATRSHLSQPLIVNVGDVMLDILVSTMQKINAKGLKLSNRYSIFQANYILATVHRAENTDCEEHLTNIIKEFSSLKDRVIWPLHPRTKKCLAKFGLEQEIKNSSNIIIIDPISYEDMIILLKNAKSVITDSGGIQKEAYILGVPCLTCRNETEGIETVETGWNKIVGLGAYQIQGSTTFTDRLGGMTNVYGDGFASKRIVGMLERFLKKW